MPDLEPEAVERVVEHEVVEATGAGERDLRDPGATVMASGVNEKLLAVDLDRLLRRALGLDVPLAAVVVAATAAARGRTASDRHQRPRAATARSSACPPGAHDVHPETVSVPCMPAAAWPVTVQ